VRTLFVASSGGHLKQLHRLRPRFPLSPDAETRWATYDSPQSRSMLAGQDVLYVPYQRARDAPNLARNLVAGYRLMREWRPDVIVSTGSQIAVSFMLPGRAHGVPCHFIESAARSTAPSLTGRILRQVPGVQMYTQYPRNARWPWRYGGSVFEGFRTDERQPTGDPTRFVVTAGTFRGYGFRRLFEQLVPMLPPGSEVLWQVGDTDTSGLGIDSRESVPAHELDAAMREADVVIAHAGVGSALGALEAGKTPILVPRRVHRNEHVDDHQVQIAEELAARGLAIHREVEDLTWEDVLSAASREVSDMDDPVPFFLAGSESDAALVA
jgi:UDP-N-acetylglucosamine transferase subunit ALG13